MEIAHLLVLLATLLAIINAGIVDESLFTPRYASIRYPNPKLPRSGSQDKMQQEESCENNDAILPAFAGLQVIEKSASNTSALELGSIILLQSLLAFLVISDKSKAALVLYTLASIFGNFRLSLRAKTALMAVVTLEAVAWLWVLDVADNDRCRNLTRLMIGVVWVYQLVSYCSNWIPFRAIQERMLGESKKIK